MAHLNFRLIVSLKLWTKPTVFQITIKLQSLILPLRPINILLIEYSPLN